MNQDPLIGKQLANYHIERRLGQGGMASVYYATDVNLRRPVAIKLIDARYQGDSEIARRFVDEARLIARWRHENVIQVYYAGQDEGVFFFAMEYVEGMSLAELMDDYGASGELMPHADVIKIGRSVAAALDYAHQQGVIHRDVKPSNVMISFDDRVVLTDFGLALDVERGTMGQIFGTPHYIAPEQVRSSADVVPQSDIYALGVMMFEMLTGSVPFDDPSAATLAMQHLTMPPPSPRSINPALNEATEAVLLKALEKEASQRYQTGAALIDALEAAFTAGEPAPVSSLPLPPAAVGTAAQRNVSRLSVSDKIALHLEQQPKSQPIPRPRAGTPRTQVAKGNETKPAKGINKGLLAAGGLILLLVVAIGGFALLGHNNSAAPELPTLAATSTDSTSVAAEASTDTPVPPASATPAPTIAPSDTPAQVAVVPTETLAPSETPLPTTAPSDTPVPTDTPVPPTATPLPSDTPVPPTATPLPTDTPNPPTAAPQVAVNTPAPTVLYPNGRRVQLFWDEYSFYVWNGSGSSIRVSPFKFEALDATGNPLPFSFDGGQWSRFYGSVEKNKCDGLEIGRAPGWLRPAQCRGYNSVVNPMADDPMVFWTGQGGSPQFRVLWNGKEIARCAISDMTCQVLLPPE